MKKTKDRSSFYNYYHCYSSTVSNILAIPEIEVLYHVRLLELQINYQTKALSSILYSITDEFVNNNCNYENIRGEQILDKLTSIEEGKYCLLTKTKNLIYCDTFQKYADILHFVTLEKRGNCFYIKDNFNGVEFFELVNIQKFDFTDSILTVLSLNNKNINKKRQIGIHEIVSWYEENNKDNIYRKYANYLKKNGITIDTVKSFTINGLLSSRLAFLYLLKQQNYITSEEYSFFSDRFIFNAEYIKLLLVKLHFRKKDRDMDKVISLLYEFEAIEKQVIYISRNHLK